MIMEIIKIAVYVLISVFIIITLIYYIHTISNRGWEMFIDIRVYDPYYDNRFGDCLTEEEELIFRKQISDKFNIPINLAREAINQSRKGNSKWFKRFNTVTTKSWKLKEWEKDLL